MLHFTKRTNKAGHIGIANCLNNKNNWTTQLEIRRWLERIKHFELSDTEVLENQYMVFYQSRSLSIKAVICVVSDPCFSITRLEVFFPLTTIKPPSAATAPAGKQSPAALLMYCGTWMISLRAMQRAGRWKLALVPSRPSDRRCAGAFGWTAQSTHWLQVLVQCFMSWFS